VAEAPEALWTMVNSPSASVMHRGHFGHQHGKISQFVLPSKSSNTFADLHSLPSITSIICFALLIYIIYQ